MDDRALMQMVLEELEALADVGYGSKTVLQALRERLAQPDYKQTRLNLCGVCGWDAVVPGEGCLNCKRLIKPENNADYERGFIDGRQDQMRSSVDKAVNRMARREWVGLTTGEAKEFYESDLNRADLINKIDEFLEEKNT